ncbi:MAG: hypothetical protein NC408_00810 [Candidatus Gastranaerophilales bacterium]|nr:hypothetical protein [Candidatus Gastranaerophilales bacterium]MCM1072925.1 hypothetical protein [Bacteroides sp.]
MKLLKVLGITSLVSGAACFATYIYNEAKWEERQRLWWSQEMVRHYNPEKYNELKNAKVEDLRVWQEAETEIRDSVEHARSLEGKAQRAYFEGGCCK